MDLHEGGTELLQRLQLRFATSFRIYFLQGKKSEGPRGSEFCLWSGASRVQVWRLLRSPVAFCSLEILGGRRGVKRIVETAECSRLSRRHSWSVPVTSRQDAAMWESSPKLAFKPTILLPACRLGWGLHNSQYIFLMDTLIHGFYKLCAISAWVGASPAAETEQQGCSWLRRHGLSEVEAKD